MLEFSVGMLPSVSMPRSYRLREPLRSNSTPLPRDKDLGTTARGHLPMMSRHVPHFGPIEAA